MGKSLGKELNFEEVCFEFGTEYWYACLMFIAQQNKADFDPFNQNAITNPYQTIITVFIDYTIWGGSSR